MGRQIVLGPIDQVEPGQANKFDVPGVGAVAVYCVDRQYYATSDECTHGVASLSADGVLAGHVIECGWHGGKFDIRTGAFLCPPCAAPLKVFPVTVDGSMLTITVDA